MTSKDVGSHESVQVANVRSCMCVSYCSACNKVERTSIWIEYRGGDVVGIVCARGSVRRHDRPARGDKAPLIADSSFGSTNEERHGRMTGKQLQTKPKSSESGRAHGTRLSQITCASRLRLLHRVMITSRAASTATTTTTTDVFDLAACLLALKCLCCAGDFKWHAQE
jgi:hypothetical protein